MHIPSVIVNPQTIHLYNPAPQMHELTAQVWFIYINGLIREKLNHKMTI